MQYPLQDRWQLKIFLEKIVVSEQLKQQQINMNSISAELKQKLIKELLEIVETTIIKLEKNEIGKPENVKTVSLKQIYHPL